METTSNNPLVSIIVPSFNQGRFIKETIESCLQQDYRPLEVIVIDGASTDNTLDVLHEYDDVPEVRWVSEPDDGVAYAVNKGLEMAQGEIAGIQASDDAYAAAAVSSAVETFKSNSGLGLVYGDCQNVDADGREMSMFRSAPYSLENFLCGASLVLQPAAFFKLGLARELGGWNPDYFVCDTELWLRMLFRTDAKKVDEVWAVRHMHADQRNNQSDKIAESYRRMIWESPDISHASAQLRRAARCGMFKTIAGYSMNPFQRRYRYLFAYLSYPKIAQLQPKLFSYFIPGYWTFRHWARKFNRLSAKLRGSSGAFLNR